MKLKNFHLWVGLIASVIIFLEAISGLFLVHTNWLQFDTKTTTYQLSENHFTDDVNIAEALQRASLRGEFSIDKVRLVMNHTLGDGHHGRAGNYKVRLRDAEQTVFVFDTKGNLLRKETNEVNNIIRDFHYGELEGYDLTWLVDIAAITIIFLTLTGTILGIRDLQRRKRMTHGKKGNH